jgi:hypothetical protein
MLLYKFLPIFFFVIICLPSGQANLVYYNSYFITPPPVEKVKPVKKKKKAGKKKRSRFRKILRTQPEPKDLGNPTLTFWLIFAISSILLAIFAAFVIGLGMAPWIVAFYLMLAAEITAFAILISIIWVDKPGDPAIVQFVMALLALVAVDVVIGLTFVIWGLAIAWIFGWIIGLVLLGLGAIFLAIHLILANKNA